MDQSPSYRAEFRALTRRTAPLLLLGRPGLRRALTARLAFYARWQARLAADLAAVGVALTLPLTPAQAALGAEVRAELPGLLSRLANLAAADRELLLRAGGKAGRAND